MSETIFHIYDKMFKKILTLSSTAVINLINGLFDTEYPTNSEILYNWTEFEDDKLKKTLADTILTINGRYSYHMEAQITEDDAIVLRVFQYSFSHAERTRIKDGEHYILYFPEPKIIYFDPKGNPPDHYGLTLDFGSQGTFDYRVSTFNYLTSTPEELTQKKLIILIPFELLKLREIMKKERSPENLEALQNLIQNDIIGSINENQRAGNITAGDAHRLRHLTRLLYQHIYAHYEELEVLNEMTDESLIFDIDILEKKYETAMAEKDSIITEQESALAEQKSALAEQKSIIAEKDAEIKKLQQKLAEAGII